MSVVHSKIKELYKDANGPNWIDGSVWESCLQKCHDWRNYIPDDLAEVWEELSKETRMALFILAKRQASAEDWD